MAFLIVKVLMSFSEPFSCSQHTSLVQCANKRTDRGEYEIIRSTPLCMSVNAYLGQRWFAERHQLHRATQSLAACAFCPNTLTLLLMQRRYLCLLMLIIHKLLARPSFIAWKAKPWQIFFFLEKKASPQHNVRQEISVDINTSGCATTTQMW